MASAALVLLAVLCVVLTGLAAPPLRTARTLAILGSPGLVYWIGIAAITAVLSVLAARLSVSADVAAAQLAGDHLPVVRALNQLAAFRTSQHASRGLVQKAIAFILQPIGPSEGESRRAAALLGANEPT